MYTVVYSIVYIIVYSIMCSFVYSIVYTALVFLHYFLIILSLLIISSINIFQMYCLNVWVAYNMAIGSPKTAPGNIYYQGLVIL